MIIYVYIYRASGVPGRVLPLSPMAGSTPPEGPKAPQEYTKMAPVAPRAALDGPPAAYDAWKTPRDGHQTAQEASRTPREGPRSVRKRPKAASRRATVAELCTVAQRDDGNPAAQEAPEVTEGEEAAAAILAENYSRRRWRSPSWRRG